jgi:predicted transcriptional regulator
MLEYLMFLCLKKLIYNFTVRFRGLESMKKERSKWEIISDILRVTKEEEKVKKTRIMQKAYLDWRIFDKHFDFLLDEGFIAECKDPECYVVTENGQNLFKKIQEISEMSQDSKEFEHPAEIFPAAIQKGTLLN